MCWPVLSSLLLVAMVPTAIADHEAIIDWVRSRGGFFSDKMEMRPVDPDDPSSPFGVFAKQDIFAKERLLNVPHSCFIGLWGDEALDNPHSDPEDEEEDVPWYWENICRVSKKLMKEMRLGKDSDFAPFIAYLKTQQKGQIPATWSQDGKNLLRTVLGEGGSKIYGNNILPPRDAVDWIDKHFKQTGCIDPDDPFEEHAVALTIQRGYDKFLIPIWDMFNHQNGPLLNTENDSMYAGGGIEVRASKTIHAGEEIYTTYNECLDCNDQTDYWGSPEILRDFGFVEQDPQIWVIDSDDFYIWFEKEIDEDTGEPEIFFMEEEDWYLDEQGVMQDGRPNEAGIIFLKEQLKRLQILAEKDLTDRGPVPEKEWNTTLQFHRAYTDAISGVLAIVGNSVNEEL